MTTADEDLMAIRSSDIGLDSLISVDIRSWFLKNFEVSIPVLKIMGNDIMADLAELVASQVPSTLLPGLQGGEAPTSGGDQVATKAASQPKAATSQTEAAIDERRSSDESSSSSDKASEKTYGDSVDGSSGFTTPVRTESLTEMAALSKGPVKIDWDAEIALPEAAKVATDKAPALKPRTIVLTGVSGLLGRHLLSRLLQDASMDEIFCIAVRRLKERLQSKELPENERVRYFEGDLEQPRLGLSEKDAARIFGRADAVIHNGADTSHLKFYPAIKAANTGSTKELIRYCMARKVPMHYLSTVGVALLGGYESFPEVSVAHCAPPVDGSYGYIAAKWASERMLEQLQKQHGVNVWIHRPSTIIREGADAENAAAQLDWMNALVAYMRKTEAVPAMHNLRGALDLVYVQSAVASILGCVFANAPSAPAGGASYVHQVGDIVLPLNRFQEFVAGPSGAEGVEVLPVAKWAARAVDMGLNRGVAALIESMDEPGQPHYPRMLREGA